MEATKNVSVLKVQSEKPKAQYARYTSEQNVLWLLGSAKRALQDARFPKSTIDEMVEKCLGSVYPQSEYVLSDYVSWSYGEREIYTPSTDDEGDDQMVKLQAGQYFIGDLSMLTDKFDDAIRAIDADFDKLAMHNIDGTNVIVIPVDGEMKTDQGDEYRFWRAVFIVDNCNPEHIQSGYVLAQFSINRQIDIFVSDEEDGRYMIIGDMVFDMDYQNRCYYCGEKYCDESCLDSDDDDSEEYNDDDE